MKFTKTAKFIVLEKVPAIRYIIHICLSMYTTGSYCSKLLQSLYNFKPGTCRPLHTWFLLIAFVCDVGMCVFVCVHMCVCLSQGYYWLVA